MSLEPGPRWDTARDGIIKGLFTIQFTAVCKLDLFNGDKTDYFESQIETLAPGVLIDVGFLCIFVVICGCIFCTQYLCIFYTLPLNTIY